MLTSSLFRFVTMQAFDRQTDGQTDRKVIARARSNRLSFNTSLHLHQVPLFDSHLVRRWAELSVVQLG